MATWIPKYNTRLVEPLVTNLLTWIKAHMKDALEWANGGAGADYAGFADGAVFNSTIGMSQEVFPDLMVWKVTTPKLDEAGDESELQELHHVILLFELVGSDPTELTTRQWRWMLALDSVCRNIPGSVLTTGMTGTRHGAVEVITHDYGVLRGGGEQYSRIGMLTVAIAIAESGNNNYVRVS